LQRAANLLGLNNLLDHKLRNFRGAVSSRGVVLGRAIVAEPPVCLMDEPLSSLDAPDEFTELAAHANAARLSSK
jgi:sn-glycerol 3-phosphate transport system ATP-binding protein